MEIKEHPSEAINGKRLLGVLQSLIKSRRLCKMMIPNTSYAWITLLLEVKKENNTQFLLVDGTDGFEKALSLSHQKEIVIEFFDIDRVPCRFKVHVEKNKEKTIWTEFPDSILRNQKRAFYRIEAPAGTEIVLALEAGKEEKGAVRDYSVGGVAFIAGGQLKIKKDEQIKDLYLRIPQEDHWIIIPIPLAVVRRVEAKDPGKILYGLEFLQISDMAREQLGRDIFDKQRSQIRKVRRI